MKLPGKKKNVAIAASENLAARTQLANFIFGVLNWDKMDCFSVVLPCNLASVAADGCPGGLFLR